MKNSILSTSTEYFRLPAMSKTPRSSSTHMYHQDYGCQSRPVRRRIGSVKSYTSCIYTPAIIYISIDHTKKMLNIRRHLINRLLTILPRLNRRGRKRHHRPAYRAMRVAPNHSSAMYTFNDGKDVGAQSGNPLGLR